MPAFVVCCAGRVDDAVVLDVEDLLVVLVLAEVAATAADVTAAVVGKAEAMYAGDDDEVVVGYEYGVDVESDDELGDVAAAVVGEAQAVYAGDDEEVVVGYEDEVDVESDDELADAYGGLVEEEVDVAASLLVLAEYSVTAEEVVDDNGGATVPRAVVAPHSSNDVPLGQQPVSVQ
ncbi:hypothetical protein LTR36_006060 [Oleoguttula mirabilis]|uniref:Uncharacterized protein n=1 Tax=Oleoguttula mirabilis TaxID=1507867 RepID=A0AAV9JCP5_9PEZI|nr:hypothetical protein LTR36_006060 [Oleoguttula mirabilis]